MIMWFVCILIFKNLLIICDCNDWFIIFFGLELKKELNLIGYLIYVGIIVKLLV